MKMALSRSFRRDSCDLWNGRCDVFGHPAAFRHGHAHKFPVGAMVPICAYIIIMAISLNLTVGILGELSLGHAGFMSVGGFVGAFVSVCWGRRAGLALLYAGVAGGDRGRSLVRFLIGIPACACRGLSCHRWPLVRSSKPAQFLLCRQRCVRLPCFC